MADNNSEDTPGGVPVVPGGGQGMPEGAPSPGEREAPLLDRASLDALLAEDDAEKRKPGEAKVEQAARLSQDELDALVAKDEAGKRNPGEAKVEQVTRLSQDELDALVAEDEAARENPGETALEQAMRAGRDKLDALSAEDAGAGGNPVEFTGEQAVRLSQSELDALFSDEAVGGATPGEISSPDMSQFFDASTLDALLDDDTVLGPGGPQSGPSGGEAGAVLGDDTVLGPVVGADAGPQDIDVDAILAAREREKPDLSHARLDQSAIDALLAADEPEPAAAAPDAMLDQSAIDALLAADEPEPAAAAPDAMLDQSAIDALLSVAASDSHGSQDAVAGETPDMLQPAGLEVPLMGGDLESPIIHGDEALSTGGGMETELAPSEPVLSAEMLNTLSAAVGGGEQGAAPAKPEEGGQGAGKVHGSGADASAVLGRAIEKHRKHDEAEPAPVAASVKKDGKAEGAGARRNLLKVITTLAVGTVSALAVFTYLFTHQERVPDVSSLEQMGSPGLTSAISEAGRLAEGGSGDAAAELLRRGLSASGGAGDARAVADARYLLAKISFGQLGKAPNKTELRAALDDVNAFLDAYPGDARMVDCLRWKAALVKLQGAVVSATALYTDLIGRSEGHPELDAMLMEAAQTAMEAGRSGDEIAWLERVLRDYAGSPRAREAKLLLGAAYGRAGRLEDAISVLSSLAEGQPNTREGAEAASRLAQIELDRGRPDEAIRLLEYHAKSATSVEGNDRVYLALGRAYRSAGKLGEARATLNDVLNFFPESEMTPAVHVELSRVLGEQGEANQALMTARQAVKLYPKDALALNHLAEMLERSGAFEEAAPNRVAAFDADGKPGSLLAAARDFRRGGAVDQAIEQYRRLVGAAPGTAEGIEGSIELCEALYERGQATEAAERLENLALATPAGPRQLPVLIALGKLYSQMGVNERAVEIYKQVAGQSVEPSVQALAASSLMSNGAWDEGIALARRVDVGRLDAKTASGLLLKLGEGLLMKNPRDGAAELAKAYGEYPDQRTGELEGLLLKAWLALGNVEGADGVVASLESSVKAGNSDHMERLVRAAIQCGDAAFELGDYARAAGLYGKVTQLAEPVEETAPGTVANSAPTATAVDATAAVEKAEMTPEMAWAKYQQANSLMRLGDYGESARLFDEVAASTAPFADEAKIKGAGARVQQRLGWPAPGSPAGKANAKEGRNAAAKKTG